MNDSPDNRKQEDPFWRALKQEAPEESSDEPPHTDLTAGGPPPSEEARERRRRSLLSMLAANEARQLQARRQRLPALVPGLPLAVRAGEHAGKQGTVVDADYIHGRALLQFAADADPHWVPFRLLETLEHTSAGPDASTRDTDSKHSGRRKDGKSER